MRTAYILAAYRTAGCKAKKGKFKHMRPDDLAAESYQRAGPKNQSRNKYP